MEASYSTSVAQCFGGEGQDTENKYHWDMWLCLRCMNHIGLSTDKCDMSFLGPPISVSHLQHEGTVPSGPYVSRTSQV